MDTKREIDSDNSKIQSNVGSEEPFDIRKYMKYGIIRELLIENPTELALLEITCIMINNNIIKKNIIKKNSDEMNSGTNIR